MSRRDEHPDLETSLGLRWERPPARMRRRVGRLPDVEPAPALGPPEHRERWTPSDVRGATLLSPAAPALRVHSFSWADVALRIVPPAGQDLWAVQGRVWLHEPSSTPMQVILSQGDHVLAVETIADGEPFELREALGRGWRIEVHAEGQPPLLVEEAGDGP